MNFSANVPRSPSLVESQREKEGTREIQLQTEKDIGKGEKRGDRNNLRHLVSSIHVSNSRETDPSSSRDDKPGHYNVLGKLGRP